MVWPVTMARQSDGGMMIGGVTLTALAERYGTPLYIYDEATLRHQARRFRAAFTAAYPRSRVVFGGKAFPSPAIMALMWDEGIGLDVVSGGELYAGLAAGVPAAAITFHGNNKARDELLQALAAGVGTVAVDNLDELALLAELTDELGTRVPVMLRLNPGVTAHTHAKIATGGAETKFGMPVGTGVAAEAVRYVMTQQHLSLVGYHAHVGSQLVDATAVVQALEKMVAFAAEMRDRHGATPRVISPGGGFGIAHTPDQHPADVEQWAAAVAASLTTSCARYQLPLPELVVEPGRALVGQAGVALYQIGARKEMAAGRTYVAVDGGMADNIRPALYGAVYTAELANRAMDGPRAPVAIAGKFCETGDMLIERVDLPPLAAGDLLAVPAAGAYSLAMASNYNLAPRPAVVMVAAGKDWLVRRRETYADLLAMDVWARPA